MKNKEESPVNSLRGNPSSTEETKGSLSRPGSTAAARVEQPALSLTFEFLKEAAVDESNIEPALQMLLEFKAYTLRRTAVCGAACTVVWGASSAMAAPTRFVGLMRGKGHQFDRVGFSRL
jgi:hypothetical protein